MSDPKTDALVAARFPAEWRRANDPTLRSRSKARNNLRRRYRLEVELEKFKADNPEASCANCDNLLTNPGCLKGTYCAVESDFHGYASTELYHLCTYWRVSISAPPPGASSAPTNLSGTAGAEAAVSGGGDGE